MPGPTNGAGKNPTITHPGATVTGNSAPTSLVQIMGFEEPAKVLRALLWPIMISCLALAVCVICTFYSFESGRQLNQYVYWMQREEGFVEQLSSQGTKVPQDILDHIKKEHEK